MIKQSELDSAGITRLEVATAIKMPYGTLCSKINGYSTMTEEEEKAIRKVLEKKNDR